MSRLNFRNPLWLKESGSYVDIFSSEFHGNDIEAIKSEIDGLSNNPPRKDDEKSVQFRSEGNQFFSQAKYHLALEKYNQSLCYANNDTDAMAFAYSNRSSCYLKLTLFKECLNDIELVKQSKFPFSLMHKLDSRQAECLDALNGNVAGAARIDNQNATLSFGEHAKYGGVADCLELQQNTEWGPHIITTRDLTINETIMVEKPFSFVGHECSASIRYSRCSHCYKALMNFIPCKECMYSMFCNKECLEAANKARHRFECQLTKVESTDCECNEKEFHLVLDMLWKINLAFDTVEELIPIIESFVRGDSIDIEASCDARFDVVLKRLVMTLQLKTNKEKQNSGDVQRLIGNTLKNYFVVMKLPEFRDKFVSVEHSRFLQHFILHLVHIAKQSILFSDLSVDVNIFREAELRDYGIGVYPIGSILNHSCVPNVYCYSVDNRLICKIIRPIKSGEQLFRSYLCGQLIINDDESDPSYHFLKTEYKIDECKCSSCSSSQSSTDPWFETKDPHYSTVREVLTNKIASFFRMTDVERQSYVDKAISYLNKYESIHPIHEIFVVQMYLHNYWMLTTAQEEQEH